MLVKRIPSSARASTLGGDGTLRDESSIKISPIPMSFVVISFKCGFYSFQLSGFELLVKRPFWISIVNLSHCIVQNGTDNSHSNISQFIKGVKILER